MGSFFYFLQIGLNIQNNKSNTIIHRKKLRLIYIYLLNNQPIIQLFGYLTPQSTLGRISKIKREKLDKK